jgi:Flp pilus assembly protein TadG
MNVNWLRRLIRDERGSMSLELALLAPVLVVIMLFVVMLGRLVLANQSVGDIAADAARAASTASSSATATSAANDAASSELSAHGLSCAPLSVDVDTINFSAGGSVTVHVACTTSLSGLSLLRVPGSETLTAQSSAPIDLYRQVAS